MEHYGSGEPYLPVLEALAQLCRADDSLPSLLRSVAPTWLLQLPWLGTAEDRESLRRELVGVGPDRMLREMGELLDRYTEHRSLLLVTEDLHWSDRATIQLIDYIARRRSGARLMWLASFRLAEVVASEHPLNALRHELRLHGLCEEIVLDPFSEAEIAAYLAGRSSSLGGNESFVRALHERTDGVPLFVASVIEEVLARAAQSGSEAMAGDELARITIPENVTAIIDRYVLKLSPERRELLSAAAVCGVDFRIEHARARARSRGRRDRRRVRPADARAAVARRARRPGCGSICRRRRMRFATPSSGKCSTSACRRRCAPICIARWAWRSNRSVPPAVPSQPSELAMHFDRGRSTVRGVALLRRGGGVRALTPESGRVHEPGRTRRCT